MNQVSDSREILQSQFESQAEWRRQKVIEYPDDARNEYAAKLFDKLASSVSEIDADWITAHEELFDDLPDSEAWQEMMKSVGFRYEPESAAQFLADFIKERTGGGA